MAPVDLLDWLNSLLTVCTTSLFLVVAMFAWTSRRSLAERPRLGYVAGVAVCVGGVGMMSIGSPLFPLQQVILTSLLAGLGLVIMNVTLTMADPTRRLRGERDDFESMFEGLDRRLDELALRQSEEKRAPRADRHRDLRLASLRREMFRVAELRKQVQQRFDEVTRQLDDQ